jgi:hypothetical protein
MGQCLPDRFRIPLFSFGEDSAIRVPTWDKPIDRGQMQIYIENYRKENSIDSSRWL